MADTKISGLPASTTPLAGTEELPIVQSGVTRKVSVANLTAGRAVSATQMTLTTGNLSVASGQGIDFSATPGTGTSELFSDYEEGTWTPSQGAGLTVVGAFTSSGQYTKIGNTVFVSATLNGATSVAFASGAAAICGNLPFAALSPVYVGESINASATAAAAIFASAGTTLSSAEPITATARVHLTCVYLV